MKPLIIYCYDAYCGWCFGFSKVMRDIVVAFPELDFEVLSGHMIPKESAQPIEKIAGYIKTNYKRVEELASVKFGVDYLWHIENPDKSDWYPHSDKAAIALCILKETIPGNAVQHASALQNALFVDGRDLTDDEAYRHLLEKFQLNKSEFYNALKSEEYAEKARYEFALVKQLQVKGFPTVLLQASETRFYLLGYGFTDFETMKERIDKVLADLKAKGNGKN